MNDETVVERVALAIAGETEWGMAHNAALRDVFRKQARRAIAAMPAPIDRLTGNAANAMAMQDLGQLGRQARS